MLKDTVLEFLNKYNLLNKTLIVGFSGGHDSMCLLDILFKLSQVHNFKLIAAHFNHNWRGIESKMEQDVCRHFCEERQIEFYTKTATLNMKQSEMTDKQLIYIAKIIMFIRKLLKLVPSEKRESLENEFDLILIDKDKQ